MEYKANTIKMPKVIKEGIEIKFLKKTVKFNQAELKENLTIECLFIKNI